MQRQDSSNYELEQISACQHSMLIQTRFLLGSKCDLTSVSAACSQRAAAGDISFKREGLHAGRADAGGMPHWSWPPAFVGQQQVSGMINL